MNRRNFLNLLGLTAATAAAPKFIFDMGANLYRPQHEIMFAQFDMGDSHGIAIEFEWRGQTYRHGLRFFTWDRYLAPGACLTPGEIAIGTHKLLEWKEDKIRRLMLS